MGAPPKCQGREGPGGPEGASGAWSAEAEAGGMDMVLPWGRVALSTASSPE